MRFNHGSTMAESRKSTMVEPRGSAMVEPHGLPYPKNHSLTMVFSKRQRITLRLLYAIDRPSVVYLSVVCDVGAPYSGG